MDWAPWVAVVQLLLIRKRGLMKFNKSAVVCVAFALSTVSVAMAGSKGTVYLQPNTNGMGVGYAMSVSNDWALRGQYNFFKRGYSGDVGDFGSGATLNTRLKLSSLQLLADWYPTDSGFRLTGGLVFNRNRITVAGRGYVNGVASQSVNAEVRLSRSVSP